MTNKKVTIKGKDYYYKTITLHTSTIKKLLKGGNIFTIIDFFKKKGVNLDDNN